MKQVESFSGDAAARLPSDRQDPSPRFRGAAAGACRLVQHVEKVTVSLAVTRTLVSSNSRAPAIVFMLAPSLLEGWWAQAERQKIKTPARMHEIPAVQTSPDRDRTACRGIPPVRSQVGSGAQIAERSKSRGIIIKAALGWTLMAAPVLLPRHV